MQLCRLNGSQNTLNSTFGPVLSLLGEMLPESGIEIDAAIWPNPFYGVAPNTFIASNQVDLSLVDGGEDGEVIPIQPLLVKARGVDVILAIDAVSWIHHNSSKRVGLMCHRPLTSTILRMAARSS